MEKIDIKFISQSEVAEHSCPVCKRVFDAVTAVSDSPDRPTPKAGDFSICAYCTTVNVYVTPTQLRVATTEECELLPPWAKQRVGMR